MKLRILERYDSNHSAYYIVQKKTWFGWRNLWPDYRSDDEGWVTWDRTFRTSYDAEDALIQYVHEHRQDKVIKVLEI